MGYILGKQHYAGHNSTFNPIAAAILYKVTTVGNVKI